MKLGVEPKLVYFARSGNRAVKTSRQNIQLDTLCIQGRNSKRSTMAKISTTLNVL